MQLGHIVYVRNSAAAVQFYMDVFGLELGYHVKNGDGSYFHSELALDDHVFLVVAETQEQEISNNIVCLGMTLDGEASVRRAFEMLSDGGKVRLPLTSLPWSPCCAEVVDRFGVWWCITAPQHRPGDDFDPDSCQMEVRA